MATGLIALGSNLGDPPANVQRAWKLLDEHPDVHVLRRSGLHRTQPIGGPQGQAAFVNAAATVTTSLAPPQLFEVLRGVENDLGRERRQRWAARVIDLDLLLFDELIIDLPQLTIPHPRMAFRRFVLEPATEVAAAMVHPRIGWTIQRLLQHLNATVNYVSLTGLPGTGKSDLAQRVTEAQRGTYLADPQREPLPEISLDRELLGTEQQELERLRARGSLLLRGRCQTPGSLSVSDFWFDQQLAYLQLGENASLGKRITTEYLKWQERIVHPKLRVMLVARTAPANDCQQEETASQRVRKSVRLADCRDRLQTELHVLFSRPGQGPSLELDADDPEWAVTDLLAAVQAMQ